MNESHNQEVPDELQRQIRAALRVEDSPTQLAQLTAYWHRRSRGEQRRRLIALASSLAAMVLLAITATLEFRSGELTHVPLVTNESQPESPSAAVETPIHAGAEEQPSRPEQAESFVREPTTYERFVFAARSPRTAGRPHPAAAVRDLLTRTADSSETDIESLVQSSGLNRVVIEREVLRRLAHWRADDVRVMLPLLEVCGTSRSLPALFRLTEREELCTASMTAIEQIGRAPALAELADWTTDRRIRATVYRRLLTADEESLDVYLQLIHKSNAMHEVLAVASEIPAPVQTSLLRRLDDGDTNVRLAAALVLASADNPEITRELIARVTREEKGVGNREAWIALLNSRSEQAARFLEFAASQPRLMGPFRRARNWSLVNLSRS